MKQNKTPDRASEFLKCLGNGKGRVTEEDENPEEYEMVRFKHKTDLK